MVHLMYAQVKWVNDDLEEVQNLNLSKLFFLDFIDDGAHSYPNLLINLCRIGLCGDANIFKKALKHLGVGLPAHAAGTCLVNDSERSPSATLPSFCCFCF